MGRKIIRCENRESWLEERKNGIGASEVAAVIGLSKWESPLTVWAKKRGLIEEAERSPEAQTRMRIGRAMEPVIASEYVVRHPKDQIEDPGEFALVVDPEREYCRATLDRLIVSSESIQQCPAPLELKTAGERYLDQWEQELPVEYACQVQYQMMVLGAPVGVLAALVGGNRYFEFIVPRDDEFIQAMARAIDRFWACVESGDEPDVSLSLSPADHARALALIHPDDNGETIALPGDAYGWDARLLEVKEEISRLEEEKAELEGRIKSAIGASTYGELPGGIKYSWKTQERPEVLTKASKFRVLRRSQAGKTKRR